MKNIKLAVGLNSLNSKYLLERIEAEIAFARYLADRKGVKEWKKLVIEAENLSIKEISSPKSDLHKVLSGVEDILFPLSIEAKKYCVYCVGHAHIDMNWMWSWPETVAVTNDSFRTVLSLLEEFPEFHFSQSQASVYEIVEKFNPDMLEKIREHILSGRWEVLASHWVENDNNIVSGEALCRHILYTRRYMKKLFNLESEDIKINWAPDTFGHAATIPIYLSNAGIKYMYLHRPGMTGVKRPQVFWWEAANGSRILVKNDMKIGYNFSLKPLALIKYLTDFWSETGFSFGNVVYGVGDHGGGPTRRDIICGIDMDKWPVFPRVKFSKAVEFFEILEREGRKIPVIKGELNFEFTGCYTSQALIKKAVNFGERNLINAEKAALFAKFASGRFYDNSAFEANWRKLLFMHFHDILPGSGVHDTRTYAHGLYQDICAYTGITETESLRAIAARIDTSKLLTGKEIEIPDLPIPLLFEYSQGAGVGFGSADGMTSCAFGKSCSGMYPFIIFNPGQRDREEIAEFVIWDNAIFAGIDKSIDEGRQFCALDAEGKETGCQRTESGVYWGHRFIKLACPVKVPAFGYSVYWICEKEAPHPEDIKAVLTGVEHQCPYAFYEMGVEGIENEHLRLEIDMNSGGIKTLIDKKLGNNLIDSSGAPILEYWVERPHRMTSWELDHFYMKESAKLISVSRLYKGPLRAALELKYQVSQSEILLRYELRAGDPNLYISTDVFWFERGSEKYGIPSLNLLLPLKMERMRAEYEIPFGSIERDMPGLEEVPALHWVKVSGEISGKRCGLLLMNDCKHGHSFYNSVLKLSLIRSSYDPDPLPEIGKHQINIALRGFSADMSNADAILCASEFINPLKIISTDIHNGKLPVRKEFIYIKTDSAILSGLKKAEGANGMIMRFYNPKGKISKLKIVFDKDIFGKIERVGELDINEQELKGKKLFYKGNALETDLNGYEIKTLLILFDSEKA